MTTYPTQRTPFNISDIVAKESDDFGGYGSDSSDKQKQILYIGSAPLERVVAFKAFFETIKLNLKKDVDIATYASRNFQIIKEKSGTMSYNVVLKIVGHTVNESMNNLAKIEELQRLILPSRATVGKYEAKGKDKKKTYKKSQDFSFEGVSAESRTSLPLFFVHFRNIINSGHQSVPKEIDDFGVLRNVGFPCHIANINYEPDVEAGFFDYNNFLWPKIITLNLTLNYESDNLFDEFRGINKKVIMPFQPNGHYSKNDSSLFPFGVVIRDNDLFERPAEITPAKRDFTSQQMNRLDLHSSQKGFVSIFLPGWSVDEMKENKAYDDLSIKKSRHIKFKPFIENFSRNVKTNVEMAHNANATINSRTAQHGIAFGGMEYSFKINIPSKDLDEAKKNCGKIQYLLRMFYKRYYDGTENLHVPSGMAYEDFRSKLMVYIPHMIEKTGGISATIEAEYKNSIPLFLQDLSFDIDLTAGFFEEDSNKIFPKVMSLEFKFLYNRPDLINPLYRVKDGVYRFPESKKKSKVITRKQYQLFPLAKRTFKIGSRKKRSDK